MSKTQTRLRRKGEQRARHLAAAERVTAELKPLVLLAASEGVSEVRLAEDAGVSRMTIRAWLGK